jgi:hypothetical protein
MAIAGIIKRCIICFALFFKFSGDVTVITVLVVTKHILIMKLPHPSNLECANCIEKESHIPLQDTFFKTEFKMAAINTPWANISHWEHLK